MKRKGIAAILVMMLALQLAACGGGASSQAASSEAPAASQTESAAEPAAQESSAQEAAPAKSSAAESAPAESSAQTAPADSTAESITAEVPEDPSVDATVDALEAAISEAETQEAELEKEGTYYILSYMNDGEQEVGAELLSLLGTSYLYLANDGTAKLMLMGEEEEGLTWKDGVLTANGQELPFTLENGVLRIDQDGMVMEFTEGSPEQTAKPSFEDLTVENYNESSNAGYYSLYSVVDEEGTVTDATILSALGMEMFLVLNEDGTGTFNLFGTAIEVTWNDTAIIMEDEETPYTCEAGKLVMSNNGASMNLVYAGTPEEAPAIEEAAE